VTGGPEKPDSRISGRRAAGRRKNLDAVPAVSAAVYNYNSMNDSKYDLRGFAFLPAVRADGNSFPAEIFQFPDQKRIVIIFEGGAHIWREIYMDGRPHPPKDRINGLSYLGHSVGHWEGDTLVSIRLVQ